MKATIRLKFYNEFKLLVGECKQGLEIDPAFKGIQHFHVHPEVKLKPCKLAAIQAFRIDGTAIGESMEIETPVFIGNEEKKLCLDLIFDHGIIELIGLIPN